MFSKILWTVVAFFMIFNLINAQIQLNAEGKDCFYCADMEECENIPFTVVKTMPCKEEHYCGKAEIQSAGYKKVARGCFEKNPCPALNNLPKTTAECFLCKENFCNGTSNKSFSVLLGIISFVIINICQ